MRKHIFYNTVNFQPVTFRILFFRGIQTLQMRLSRIACFWWTQLLRPFCRAADDPSELKFSICQKSMIIHPFPEPLSLHFIVGKFMIILQISKTDTTCITSIASYKIVKSILKYSRIKYSDFILQFWQSAMQITTYWSRRNHTMINLWKEFSHSCNGLRANFLAYKEESQLNNTYFAFFLF